MLGTLEGMKYCHASWVLHRDMKPGNLLLGPDGTVKLTDNHPIPDPQPRPYPYHEP